MAIALGIGGVFFKSKNPIELSQWYERWLSMPIDNSNSAPLKPERMPAGSYTVWAPFDVSTSYFEPSCNDYMINIIVDDLDEALVQVSKGGAELIGETKEYEFGRFGWFLDPERNKVELWEPKFNG